MLRLYQTQLGDAPFGWLCVLFTSPQSSLAASFLCGAAQYHRYISLLAPVLKAVFHWGAVVLSEKTSTWNRDLGSG